MIVFVVLNDKKIYREHLATPCPPHVYSVANLRLCTVHKLTDIDLSTK